MISPKDDAYLQKIACESVDKLFRSVNDDHKNMPARSQIYGLISIVRSTDNAEIVLDKFIRRQIQKLEKKEAQGNRLTGKEIKRLELCRELEEQVTKGKFIQWVNEVKQQSQEQRRQRMDEGFSVFVAHFSCHYFYRLNS